MAVEDILEQRGMQYGDVRDQADLFDDLMVAITSRAQFSSLTPVAKQSLTIIALKMSRVVIGRDQSDDNWLDIEGYARLARNNMV